MAAFAANTGLGLSFPALEGGGWGVGGQNPYPVGACSFCRVGRYAGNMDTLTFPLANQLFLLIAPRAAHGPMLDLIARLALEGEVRVFDAGNQCNVYPIAQRLRRATPAVNAALERIRVQRAFTCYQVAALLSEAVPSRTPTLALDFLSSFYDQDVKLPEATLLLHDCLAQLQHLASQAPVLVSARPPVEACAERLPMLNLLRTAAAQRWELVEAPPPIPPLRLWDAVDLPSKERN